jgi:hypothetical protein
VWMVGGWKFLGILSDDFGISSVEPSGSVVTLSVTYCYMCEVSLVVALALLQ